MGGRHTNIYIFSIIISNFLLINFVSCENLKTETETISDIHITSNGDEIKSMKIIQGEPAKFGEFPSIVSIQRYGVHFCGGSLVDNVNVLTVAHCTVNFTEEDIYSDAITILAGDILSTNSEAESQSVRDVSYIFQHPKFDLKKTGYLNDVSVIRLKTPLTFSKYIQPIQLPIEDNKFDSTLVGKVCQIAGWGTIQKATSNEGLSTAVLSLFLQKGEIKINPIDKCKQKYDKEYSFPEQICANDEKMDTCQGDSGGPLICDNVQVGIVSGGYGCGQSDWPGIYTHVAYYLKWIHEKLKEEIVES